MSKQDKFVDNWGKDYIAPSKSKLGPKEEPIANVFNDILQTNAHIMKIEFISVTPQKAKEFLEKNDMNRRLIKRNVDFIANQMLAGKWIETGDTIKFSTDGTLIDGQHRLHAIIQSKKTYKLPICTGLNKKAFEVIDTGKSRAAKDVLSAHGIENPHVVAAVVNIILTIQKNGINNTISHTGHLMSYLRRTNEEILTFTLESDPDELNDQTKFIKTGYKKFKFMPISTLGAMYFLMVKKAGVKAADYFFNKYFDGDGLAKSDPIYILRAQLMQQNSKAKINKRDNLMWFLSAWNMYRANEKCTILRSSPELPLPKIN